MFSRLTLENRSNTSISFVRTYEITHNNSPFVKTLELHKKNSTRARTQVPDSKHDVVRSVSFWNFYGAFSTFVFAWSGQKIYLEIMSEMRDASEFHS